MGQGNYSALVGEQGEDHSPYSSNNGFQRESNGLVWTEMLGRDVDIILDPDGDSPNLNFAISGAHMTERGDLSALGLDTGVLNQTEIFRLLVNDGTLDIGAQDVAFVVAGANDYLDRLAAGDGAEAILVDIAEAAATNVRRLADAGVKTIILSEVQPLQFAPDFADDAETQAELTDLVFATNEAMLASVAASGLPADVNLVTLKYGAMVEHMRSQAAGLGFTSIDTPCFDDEAETLCSLDPAVQNQHIFFDDLHFSEGAHRIAAQWWQATLASANGQASRQAGRIPAVFQYELESSLRRFGTARAPIAGDKRVQFFTDVIRETPVLQGRADDPSVRLRTLGGIAGGDVRITDRLSAGLGFRYSDARARLDGGGAFTGHTKAIHGWLGWNPGLAQFELSSAYGWIDVGQIHRPTGVDLLNAGGKTKGKFWTLGATAASSVDFGAVRMDASVGVHASDLEVRGFNEAGATGLNLAIGRQSIESTRLQLDWGVTGPAYRLGGKASLRPVLDLNYRYEFKNRGHLVASQLIDNTALPSFVETGGVSKHRLAASTGLDLSLSDRWQIGARYERTFAKDLARADAVRLQARLTF